MRSRAEVLRIKTSTYLVGAHSSTQWPGSEKDRTMGRKGGREEGMKEGWKDGRKERRNEGTKEGTSKQLSC